MRVEAVGVHAAEAVVREAEGASGVGALEHAVAVPEVAYPRSQVGQTVTVEVAGDSTKISKEIGQKGAGGDLPKSRGAIRVVAGTNGNGTMGEVLDFRGHDCQRNQANSSTGEVLHELRRK